MFPLVRTDAQARLLGVLFDRPGQKLPLGEVARRAGVPPSTASKEISRLVDDGLVLSEAMGRMRIVQANWDLPWSGELATILDHTVGLVGSIAEALRPLRGIEAAFIFGSWAARRAGQPGPDPVDVDVIIIGAPDREGVRSALRPLEAHLDRHIDPTIVTPDRWADEDDPFVATVRERPLVPVLGQPVPGA